MELKRDINYYVKSQNYVPNDLRRFQPFIFAIHFLKNLLYFM